MSKDTLQSLEVDLADLAKRLDLIKKEKAVAKSLAKTGAVDIENYGKSLEHHRLNLLHMTGPADVVDMQEFVKTKQLYLEAKENLIVAKQQVSQASKVVIKMDKAAIETTAELEAVRKALESYGRLEHFPTKLS